MVAAARSDSTMSAGNGMPAISAGPSIGLRPRSTGRARPVPPCWSSRRTSAISAAPGPRLPGLALRRLHPVDHLVDHPLEERAVDIGEREPAVEHARVLAPPEPETAGLAPGPALLGRGCVLASRGAPARTVNSSEPAAPTRHRRTALQDETRPRADPRSGHPHGPPPRSRATPRAPGPSPPSRGRHARTPHRTQPGSRRPSRARPTPR